MKIKKVNEMSEDLTVRQYLLDISLVSDFDMAEVLSMIDDLENRLNVIVKNERFF